MIGPEDIINALRDGGLDNYEKVNTSDKRLFIIQL